MGHSLVMGRLTFESIGMPLAGRNNIILSRNANYSHSGRIIIASGVGEATQKAEQLGSKKVFFIGGSSIYKAALPLVDTMHISEINEYAKKADVFFPNYNRKDWKIISSTYHKSSGAEPEWTYQCLKRMSRIVE